MAYNTQYVAMAATLRDEIVKVELLKKDSESVMPTELLLSGSNPVEISWESNDIFKPLKMSGATVRILTEEPILSLFSGGLNDWVCKIYVAPFPKSVRESLPSDASWLRIDTAIGTGWKMIWYGFLTPNVYSQKYDNTYNELSLEFIDVLANMENTKFAVSANGFWKSFRDLIDNAVATVDEAGVITTIDYVQEKIDIDTLGCMERNFIDESKDDDDGAMNYQDVLTHIMKYLNVTCCYYGNALRLYNPLDSGESATTIAQAQNNMQLSIGNVYSKATVIENTNPMEDLFQKEVMDETNMKSMMNTTAEYYKVGMNYDNKAYFDLRGVYVPNTMWTFVNKNLYNENWNVIRAITNRDGNNNNGFCYSGIISSVDASRNDADMEYGALLFFSSSYELGKVPSSLSFKKQLLMYDCRLFQLNAPNPSTNRNKLFISYQSPYGKNACLNNGFLILNIKYQYMPHFMTPLEQEHSTSLKNCTVQEFINRINWGTTEGLTLHDRWKCKLKIGDKYFDGSTWGTSEAYFYPERLFESDDDLYYNENSLFNTVSYLMHVEDGKDGYAIPVCENLFGMVEFEIYPPSYYGRMAAISENNYETGAIVISELDITYHAEVPADEKYIIGKKNEEKDIKISGEIDTNRILSLDDIQMNINTWSPYQTSYSYVIKKVGTAYSFVTENKSERKMLDKYLNYYKEPKLCVQQTIFNTSSSTGAIKPWSNRKLFTRSETGMTDKVFHIGSLTLNLTENTATCKFMERLGLDVLNEQTTSVVPHKARNQYLRNK